jgi:hypothetical protein
MMPGVIDGTQSVHRDYALHTYGPCAIIYGTPYMTAIAPATACVGTLKLGPRGHFGTESK